MPGSRAVLFYLTICLLVSTLAGCRKSTDGAEVRGTVSIDGKPLDKGNIFFVPVNADHKAAGVKIVDGAFHGYVPVTNQQIQFNSVDFVAPEDPHAKREPAVDRIPLRYQTKSTLTWDLKAGLNEREFTLESKGK